MTERLELHAFIGRVRKTTSYASLWLLIQRYARDNDFRSVTYHSIDVQSLGAENFGAVEFGIPADFRRVYLEEHLYLDDPFPAIAATRTEPFYWSDITGSVQLTARQSTYIEKASKAGFADGMIMQVFGPQARNALVSIGFQKGKPRLSPQEVTEMQWAAQSVHLHFCSMSKPTDGQHSRLSPQELEVLRWIARGKSNTVIAEIMGLSRHTVDTITRRMFGKLDVTDRTRAAVRGLAFGLIHQSSDYLA